VVTSLVPTENEFAPALPQCPRSPNSAVRSHHSSCWLEREVAAERRLGIWLALPRIMLDFRPHGSNAMEEPSKTADVVRFGPFELLLDTQELRKHGVPVKLSGQAIQVLAILAANPGQLVTREELQKKLWPGDSFGDFEHGLNAAVNKLRERLGDSALTPSYIQTLPSRGYRFIGKIESVENNSSPIETQPPQPFWKSRIALAIVSCAVVAGLLYPWVAPKVARLIRLYQIQQLKVTPLTALSGNVASPTFSPDGSQVAFAWDGENGGNGFDLYVKVIGTEKQLRLTNQPGFYHAAWSPDGKSIAFERVATNFANSGIYLISPSGGPEHEITNRCAYGFISIGVIAWSPDGKQLACVGGISNTTTRLFVISLDTLQLAPLETDCKRVISPAFSPQGDYLAWTCADILGGSSTLELQRLRDGRVTQLFRKTETIGGPLWSGGGRRLLFTSSVPAGDIWELLLASPDHPEKLPAGHDAFDLAVSPSGNRLAFAQNRTNVNIWRLNLGEPQPHPQMVVTSSREQMSPDISPKGDQIAFESDRLGSNEVWVSGIDGSNAVQLSSFGIRLTGTPRWSPDGRLIAFDSRTGGESNIYLVDPHGSFPRKLDIDIRGNNTPSWSRDGKWIYFVNGEDAHHPTGWKVPSTGGHAVSITDGEVGNPIESPDGKYVYFFRQGRLWSVRTDGTVAEPVEGMPYVSPGGWTPVRTGIYFISFRGRIPGISYFDLATKKPQLVYVWEKPLPGWVGAIPVSPDGKWLLFPQLDEQSSDLMMIENWQ
jgi:Tol biopolymer transport system component/DNA-binding winged helix-turn-helix (wHTH) protein